MPKKAPRNAFYYYMLAFKEEQRKEGIHYENLMEVQKAADPSWRAAPPSVRAKYEKKAKDEKTRIRGAPEKKYTNLGVSYAEVDAEQQMIREQNEMELKDIKNFIMQATIRNNLLHEPIYVIDVNTYGMCGTHYLMGEITVLRFTLEGGIMDYYHKIIDPGKIPMGYTADVKYAATELGLDMPDENASPRVLDLIAELIDYFNQNAAGLSANMLFTMPEKVAEVQDVLGQLYSRAEEWQQVRVLRLDLLFFHLAGAAGRAPDDGFPRENIAHAQLAKDVFRYSPGLGCSHHERVDKPVECSKSRAQRWVFTVLDKCCAAARLAPIPGKHLPPNVDIERVMAYKDKLRREAAGACSVVSSGRVSVVDSIYSASTTAWESVPNKPPHRDNRPVRLPTTDYSQKIRAAPELSEEEFPSLVGAGRGRGLERNFNKLSLNNK